MPDYPDSVHTTQNVCAELSNQDWTLGSIAGLDEYRSVATSMFCSDQADAGAGYTPVDAAPSFSDRDAGYDVYQTPVAGYDASTSVDGGVYVGIIVNYGWADAGY